MGGGAEVYLIDVAKCFRSDVNIIESKDT